MPIAASASTASFPEPSATKFPNCSDKPHGNPRPMLEPGNIPMGDFGYPVEFAAACLYLAGEAGRYMTGQMLTVDGGISVG